MIKSIKNLFLLIASSDLTENQLREACEWIDMNGAKALETAISKIRSSAEKAVLMGRLKDDNVNVEHRSWKSSYKSDLNKTSFEIDNLLRKEAGLSASQASTILIEEMQKLEKYNNAFFPQLGKQGFRRWIEQLSNYASYSEILHIAIKIRNKFLHESETDWPLKNR
jgi:hypothetical protein